MGSAGPQEQEDNEVGDWFVARALNNGYTLDQAKDLWKEVFAFASFGFCKSHAAAFALPTYISSYLKAHYPAEFLAGLLTHDPGMYPRRLIVADARRFGIAILPVDVNASDKTYRVERVKEGGGFCAERVPQRSAAERGLSERTQMPPPDPDYGVRLALSEVRDISEGEIDSLLAARAERPFGSLEDLWRRTRLSRPVLENLAHLGALDSIEPRRSRRELVWRAVDLASEARPEIGDQLGLQLEEPATTELAGLAPYNEIEEIEAELEITGIDGRRHLMSAYHSLVAEVGVVPGARLRFQRNDSQVWVAGVKVASQTPAIRSGQRIIFVTLDDATGPVDVTVFERWQARTARTVFHSWLLLVRGVVRKRGGASLIHPTDPDNVGVTVVAHEVFDLAELASDRKAGHSIATALGRQRKRQAETGLAPAEAELKARGRMWHSSGGSAGR